jgi:hypothetical protein
MGLHVHIGAKDLTPSQVKRIKHAFVKFETAFYGLNGDDYLTRIRKTSYCAPSDQWDGSRYQSLNLTNIGNPSKNTIEVRVWASTTDGWRVVTAIQMFVSLVIHAMDNFDYESPVDRIESPYASALAFCREVWSDTDTLIMPDEGSKDFAKELRSQALKAKKAMDNPYA